MKTWLAALALTTFSLAAADATGRWSGTIVRPGDDGGTVERPALVILKQEGAKLTGTAGPDDSERHDIEQGKAEEGRLTFEVQSGTMKFDLKQAGDEIAGEVTRERDGVIMRAKLMLKREK